MFAFSIVQHILFLKQNHIILSKPDMTAFHEPILVQFDTILSKDHGVFLTGGPDSPGGPRFPWIPCCPAGPGKPEGPRGPCGPWKEK